MKQNKRKETFSKILALLHRYRLRFGFSMILAALVVISTLQLPILIGEAVDCITAGNGIDFTLLKGILLKILICLCITAVSQWLMSRIHNSIVFSMVKDLRTELFKKLQRLPIRYIDAKPHGGIVSNLVSDVEQFSDGALLGFSQFFTGILTIILTLIFILRMHVIMAAAVLFITPLSFFVSAFIARKSFVYFKEQSQRRAAMTALADETIAGISTVKAFTAQDLVYEKFSRANKELGEAYLQATYYSAISNPATRFVNSLVYACVGITGAFLVFRGNLSIGMLVSALSYATQYTKPFNEISAVIAELQNSIACAERIFALQEQEEFPADPTDALQISEAQGDISFCHASFSYDGKVMFMKDINLKAHAGQRIAIVGPTGCGKTTLINLLMRFFELHDGAIMLDGKDIRSIRRESYRRQFGMVLQDTWLQTGTVYENIAMGKKDASKEEVIAAAKEAYADQFIRLLPQGYDTIIRQNGENLSAGQRQLLCIARVMLSSPDVLILDEATSSIDTRTEIKIQQALEKVMKGRTSFVVAHRLSTIQNADMILVMKDGAIIERGTHEELMAGKGFYTKLQEAATGLMQ